MAIKYVVNEEKRSVTAILEGTKFDAVNRINNRLRETDWEIDPYGALSKFLMPNKFVATVKCDERDVFNEQFGRDRAKKVVMDNYYKSMNKRIRHFEVSLRDTVQKFCQSGENNT